MWLYLCRLPALTPETGRRHGRRAVGVAPALFRIGVQGETWRFDVSVAHEDTGWDHYADRWEVLAPDGGVLGTRVLLHPHETEQPFTRSLGGVAVPEGLDAVTVRAHDSVHGFTGREFRVELPR